MKNKSTNKNLQIFADMDGVLCHYTFSDFRDGTNRWMKPGYFKGLKPNREMVNLFKALFHIKERGKKSFVNRVNVLTTVLPDKPYRIFQHKDKIYWMDKYVFNSLGHKSGYFTKVATAGTPKPVIAEKILGRKLTKNDILLDDYNVNLEVWEKAGGTGVKYLNTLNDPKSWDGPKIMYGTTTQEKIDYLYSLAS